MATLHRAGNVAVRVYANDHGPPHFDVTSPESEALVAIVDLAVLRGSLKPADRRRVWPWIGSNLDKIIDEWNRLNPKAQVAQ